MLQIRLNRPSSADTGGGGGGGLKSFHVDTVTVACPDHLVIADLPVAKGIGATTAATVVKSIGRRSRRQLGERVHFCVRCDFPIAVYGRLSPCNHAFCLDCARTDSICYLCDERIQKIQTIKMMEGIFVCAAPHCLKSFLKRIEFESHIQETHTDLLNPNTEKEYGNESEAQSVRQQTPSESTARGPTRSVISPSSNSQIYDRQQQFPPRSFMMMPPRPPYFPGQIQNFQSEPQTDSNRPPGFEHIQQESGYGNMQPQNLVMPMMMNPFGVPSFPSDGGQPFYGNMEQGSLLGYPPVAGGVSFSANYSQQWTAVTQAGGGSQGIVDGNTSMSDSQGKSPFYQGSLPMYPPTPTVNRQLDGTQGSNAMDSKDGQNFGWQNEKRDGFGTGQD